MKKRKLSIFMLSLLLSSALFSLAGCNKKGNSTSTGGTSDNSTKTSITHEHTFATEWSKNETEHWHEATCEHKSETKDKAKHTWDEGKVTTPATTDQEGVKTFTCTVCKQTKTEKIDKLPHTHTFATDWSKDGEGHWHEATCEHKSEKKDYATHTWDEGVVTTEPNYGVDGLKTFTCTVCKEIKTESIPALVGFFMPITDVFSITGKGVVVTGTIVSGTVRVNDTLAMSGVNKNVVITTIEKNKKTLDSATVGDEVGLLLRGITNDEVKRGYTLYTPNSKQNYNQVKLNLTTLTKEQGGVNTHLVSNAQVVAKLYPNVKNETKSYVGEVKGRVIFPSNLETFAPGETHVVTIIFESSVVVDKNMDIGIMYNGKMIGSGLVTELEQHTHDDNYDEIGKCIVCGFDQYLSFNYDSSSEEYSYETHLEVNGRHFFKITPKSNNTETEWQVEIEGTTEENYEVIIYDSNYKDIKDNYAFMLTNSTYYIVVIGKDNVNDITIKVVDTWL